MIAVGAFIYVICALTGCGSGADSPTNSDEQWLYSVIYNECKKVGITPEIKFKDEDRPHSGGSQVCMAAAHNTVWVYPICQDLIPGQGIFAYARHECCHLFLGHVGQLDGSPEFYQQEVDAETCVATTDW